jgi:hypothetical protein
MTPVSSPVSNCSWTAAERRSNRVARPCVEEHRCGPSNHSDDSFAQSVGRITEGKLPPGVDEFTAIPRTSSPRDLDAGLPRLLMGSRLVGSDLRAWHRFWTDDGPPGSNPVGRIAGPHQTNGSSEAECEMCTAQQAQRSWRHGGFSESTLFADMGDAACHETLTRAREATAWAGPSKLPSKLGVNRINEMPALPYRQRLALLDHSSWTV